MENKVNCLIVDDEKLARTLLESYVSKIPQLNLVAKCKNAIEALQKLQTESIDLMFLDIQMPELTGVEFLQSLKQKPVVIFTTAYPEYALEGYQLDVIDYMLKPIAFDRFMQGVNKAVERVELLRNVSQTAPQTSSIESAQDKDYLTVKADHRIYKVMFDELDYIEGLREYVAFHIPGKKRIVALESLKRLQERLPKDKFMRVHKSYIVNTTKVTSLYGNQLEIGEKQIPIGKVYKEEVVSRIF